MINSVYDYYVSNYVGKTQSKYDTHKKSELRNVYNNIVKISKKSPLYKVANTEEVQKYAIDLKETSRQLHNVAEAFLDSINPDGGELDKKAFSSNEDVLTAKYIGKDKDKPLEYLDLHIDKLATPQINTGEYLIPNSKCKLEPGPYSFDCKIGGGTYEFQFNIQENETNQDIQNKLARLFTRSGVGLEGHTITSPSGNTALEIRSLATGVQEFNGETFTISANESKGSERVMEYFGINKVTNLPENAAFSINGIDNSSASNTFTLNRTFEISLHQPSDPNEDVTVGMKQDIDSIIEDARSLADGYNSILALAEEKDSQNYEGHKLYSELRGITKVHRTSLENSGMKVDDNGYLSVDEALMNQVADEDGLDGIYSHLTKFTQNLMSRADGISINPMHYVDKTLISYPNPNPARNFANPYVTSIYSGMMFNGYC